MLSRAAQTLIELIAAEIAAQREPTPVQIDPAENLPHNRTVRAVQPSCADSDSSAGLENDKKPQ